MKLNISETTDEVLHNLATYFVTAAQQSIEEHGAFSVSLSGGSSPKKLYGLLAAAPYHEQVQWDKVYFFFGDERYVPETNPASNYQMVKKVLLEPLNIDAAQVFPVNTTLPPKDAASQYMNDIKGYFKDAEPSFDLVLLGLGDNSHTASLFPYTPVLHEQEATIQAVFLTDQQVYRITFTAPLINLAKRVAFLVYGESKAAAVFNILEGSHEIETYPAQLIQPNGELQWFLDKPAAGKLTKGS